MFVNLLDAEVAAEQVKLALEAICLEERKAAVGLGDGALRERRGSPHPPSTRSGQASTLRDGAKEPRLLRANGVVSVFMKCCTKDSLRQRGAMDSFG